MKKKIIVLSVLSVFLLVAISVVSAVNIKENSKQTKISPLYKIRTNKANEKENIIDIKEKIVKNIFRDRIFLFPKIFYKIDDNAGPRENLMLKTRTAPFSICGGDNCPSYDTNCFGVTCRPSSCPKACTWLNCESS